MLALGCPPAPPPSPHPRGRRPPAAAQVRQGVRGDVIAHHQAAMDDGSARQRRADGG